MFILYMMASFLPAELELWKQKFRDLEKISTKEILTTLSCENKQNIEAVSTEVPKLMNQLKVSLQPLSTMNATVFCAELIL